ncbi:MAG: hypothetical protein IPK26_17890 [Planctomycetes bacterium]|nr:hypothetical protein [Planctomycetota bacterium]
MYGRSGGLAMAILGVVLGSCQAVQPGSRLAGVWHGRFGDDDVREVLVIRVDRTGALGGFAYFETRAEPRSAGDEQPGDGRLAGRFDDDSVTFTLSRGGTDYLWAGIVDACGRLTGTFDGYSNDATYVR